MRSEGRAAALRLAALTVGPACLVGQAIMLAERAPLALLLTNLAALVSGLVAAALWAEVAIKFLRDVGNPDSRRRFEREVRQLVGLRHRRIVQILDYNLAYDRPFYVMPLMKGGPLTRWAGKIPPETVRSVLREMAEVLAYLHGQGAFHRDIKPDNLLVDAVGQVAVGDFGLGNNPRYTVIFTQHAAGTPGYAAPELTRGGFATAAADVYSLGATLFHLLTGIHPARASSLDPWSIRRDLPQDLRNLVLQMVHPEPQHRPTAARVLALVGGRNPAAYKPIEELPVANDNSGFWKGLLAVGGIAAAIGIIAAALSDE